MMSRFGENLRYYRNQSGYTQEQMAEKIDVALNQYQNYEHGKSFPRVSKLGEICEFLQIPADFLLSDHKKIFLDYTNKELLKEFMDLDPDTSEKMYEVLKRISELSKKYKHNEGE